MTEEMFILGILSLAAFVVAPTLAIVHYFRTKGKTYDKREQFNLIKKTNLDHLEIDNGELDCMIEIRTISGKGYLMSEKEFNESVGSSSIKIDNQWIQRGAIEHVSVHYRGTGTLYCDDFPEGIRVGLLGKSKTDVIVMATTGLYSPDNHWEEITLMWENGSWEWVDYWRVPSLVRNLKY